MEVHEDSHLNIFRRNSVSNRAYTATKRNRSINKGSLRQASLIAKSELWSSIQAGDLSRVMSIIDVDPNECESTRGSEGDNILHLACHFIDPEDLFSPYRRIAKYIVEKLPELIICPCEGPRFKGEIPLHVAVVVGDLETVKMMIEYIEDMGLDINNFRATGFDYERDDFEIAGNFPGIMYFGETILSFAAVAQQSEIVKYLLDHNANPGICDKHGNNTLHMLCYYGKFEHRNQDGSLGDSAYSVITSFLNEKQIRGEFDPFMVDLLTTSGDKSVANRKVSPFRARNKDGHSPFLLAISRGHVNVLDTLVEEFSSCSCYAYDIQDVDTWQDPDNFDHERKSALEIAVRNKDMNMIQHPIIQLVLRMKWEMFAKNMYLADLFKYVIIMLSVAVAIALLPNDIQSRIHYTDSNGPARIVVEIIVLIGILDLIFGEIGELHTRGVMGYLTGFGRNENLAQWLYVLLKISTIVARFGLRNVALENCLLGLVAIMGCLFALFFAKGVPLLGPIVVIFWQMLTGDLLIWLTVYGTVFFGYSQAYYLQMQNVVTSEGATWGSLPGSMMWLFRFLFWAYNYQDFENSETPTFTKFLFVTYAIATSILLINLLIAFFNKTVQRIFDQAEKSSKLQWAQLVMEKDSKVTFNKIGANSLKDMKNGKSRLGVTFPRFDSTGAPIPNSEKYVFLVYDRLDQTIDQHDKIVDKRIVQKMTYMDPEVDPNEARVSTSVWTRWRFTKQAEAIQPLSPLVSVRIGINAKGIKKVFPLDSSSIRTSQILVSPKKQVLSSKLVAEEPEDVIVSNVELNSR